MNFHLPKINEFSQTFKFPCAHVFIITTLAPLLPREKKYHQRWRKHRHIKCLHCLHRLGAKRLLRLYWGYMALWASEAKTGKKGRVSGVESGYPLECYDSKSTCDTKKCDFNKSNTRLRNSDVPHRCTSHFQHT